MSEVSFCWHCGGELGKLFRKPDEPVTWRTIKDPLGHEHRVHACCEKDAVHWMTNAPDAQFCRQVGRFHE